MRGISPLVAAEWTVPYTIDYVLHTNNIKLSEEQYATLTKLLRGAKR